MMRCLLSLLLALYLWQSPQALQAQCGSPDTNCDELVNVNDLLVLLGYFGTVGNEAWTEAEDCSSPDVNCDGNVNVEDLLGLLKSVITVKVMLIAMAFGTRRTTVSALCCRLHDLNNIRRPTRLILLSSQL